MSLAQSQELVRKGGAAARQADPSGCKWVECSASECTAASGVITHGPSGRTTTFGKVADAAGKLEPPKDLQLKNPKDWKIAGKSLKRLDRWTNSRANWSTASTSNYPGW